MHAVFFCYRVQQKFGLTSELINTSETKFSNFDGGKQRQSRVLIFDASTLGASRDEWGVDRRHLGELGRRHRVCQRLGPNCSAPTKPGVTSVRAALSRNLRDTLWVARTVQFCGQPKPSQTLCTIVCGRSEVQMQILVNKVTAELRESLKRVKGKK